MNCSDYRPAMQPAPNSAFRFARLPRFAASIIRRMKLLFPCIVVYLSIARSHAQSTNIAGKIFFPAYTNSSSNGFLKEYLIHNETLDNWTKLFSIRNFEKMDSPKAYIARLGDAYHKKFPGMKYATASQESKNRWFIDFLTYEPKGPKFMEWDFFRAETNATGGILVYQYAERIKYKKSIKEVDTDVFINLREKMLPFLMTNEFSLP